MTQQIKIGTLRDFQSNTHSVHLVQRGQLNILSTKCEKEYLVHVASKNAFSIDSDNNLVYDDTGEQLFHFDTFEEAQAKYLDLADQEGVALKVEEWTPADWKVE